MDRNKNLLIVTFLTVAASIICITGVRSISTRVSGSYALSEREAIKNIYDLSFVPSTVPAGNVITYLPQYSDGNDGRRNFYRDIFGMSGDFLETDEHFYLCDERGTLYVHKFENLIRYRTNSRPIKKTVPMTMSSEEILETAKKFMEENFLFLNYEEAEIFSNDEVTEIKFINRIGNLKNYAFMNSITLDGEGNVTELDYYTTLYEKFRTVGIKSMSEAVYELPLDIAEGLKVDLKKCSLVYIYADSIVQPAYLFEGELSNGKLYKSFVKASLYY